MLDKEKIKVKIAYCPGHCGINFNATTDKGTKKRALSISERNYIEEKLREVGHCTINKIIGESSIKRWKSS